MKQFRSLCDDLEHGFTFRLRPEPVPGDLRPEWRLSVVVLMLLRCGRGGRLSLKKALLLNWAVLSSETRKIFTRMVDGNRQLTDIPVRLDPSLNRALDFARAERLLIIEKKTTGSIITLLPKGQELAERIHKEPDCLETEKTFFDSLRRRLPEEKVIEILDWETTL